MAVEVDELQWNSAQNTIRALQGMLNNPKTRKKVLEAFKENNPNVTVPELDAAAPVEQKIEAVSEAVHTFMKEFREEREKEKTESKLAQIKAAQEAGRAMLKGRGYTDEGIKALEEFRDTKGLVDYEDAVKLFELDHPPARVAEPNGNMNFFGMVQNEAAAGDFHKKLMESRGEDNHAVNQMAMNAIAELRGSAPRR